MGDLRVGDFVSFIYDTKEVYPGRIVRIEGDEYVVEICTNKRKTAENEIELVRGKRDKIRLRNIC